jgi:hypothetical protein
MYGFNLLIAVFSVVILLHEYQIIDLFLIQMNLPIKSSTRQKARINSEPLPTSKV